jgi:hypothetical protein
MALPIPLVEPVMTATLPVREKSEMFVSGELWFVSHQCDPDDPTDSGGLATHWGQISLWLIRARWSGRGGRARCCGFRMKSRASAENASSFRLGIF